MGLFDRLLARPPRRGRGGLDPQGHAVADPQIGTQRAGAAHLDDAPSVAVECDDPVGPGTSGSLRDGSALGGLKTRRKVPANFAALNGSVEKRQTLLLVGVAGTLLLGGAAYILAPDDAKAPGSARPTTVSVTSQDLASTNVSQKEWVAMSEARLLKAEQEAQATRSQLEQLSGLEAKVAQLEAEKQQLQSSGTTTLAAYEAELARQQGEIAQLRQMQEQGGGPGARAGAPAVGPGGVPALYGQPGVGPETMAPAQVKLIAFESATGQSGKGGLQYGKPETSPVVVEDSPDFLPPNSVARAIVVVGVDASTGVQSQTDPLPILLRITGPARSVYGDGRLLTTRLEGCLVNGAARGDLSSEKVYVKLAKMTCPQPGGRVAVSEVKGYIAFAGKAGVRGQVVSREGGLTAQAFFAGLVGGVGRGFQANANTAFQGVTVSTNGKRESLSAGDIATGGIGEGVSKAGDMVSQYLIERAEQYQPVIDMPTGLSVEIVFLEGVYVRAPDQ